MTATPKVQAALDAVATYAAADTAARYAMRAVVAAERRADTPDVIADLEDAWTAAEDRMDAAGVELSAAEKRLRGADRDAYLAHIHAPDTNPVGAAA